MSNSSASYELLDSRIQKWIHSQGWESLKEIQENAIPVVLEGDSDVIISAATAGGKTEAAFLPILTTLLKQSRKDGYQVLYISPLKALINDQYRRLKAMTSELEIDVIPWHGDIDASRKQRSLKNPSGIVIITPESLESFFINHKQYLARAFSSLTYIVIDELHSFIGKERGKQLQSLLSRIEHILNHTIPRIAMSATFSDYDIVRDFLRPDGLFPCNIPPKGESNHEIKILVKEYIDTREHRPEEDIAKELYLKLRGSNNLIFANSRGEVETYASLLSDLCESSSVPNEFRTHHGNLSKNERELVESELQKGEFPVSAVCTVTLELGVDIGTVKSIAQIGKASSVSGLRQRLGRSGRRGDPSLLRVFSIDSEDETLISMLNLSLFQNIAVIELLKDEKYESPNILSFHFSTLIQQILSVISQFGAFQAKEGWMLLCKSGAFRNVTVELFLELLHSLANKEIIQQIHTGQIVIGIEGEKILRQKDFYVAFNTPVEYKLINKANQRKLGFIESLPSIGEIILFAGRRWIVDSICEDPSKLNHKVYVSQCKSVGRIRFGGEKFDIDKLICKKMLSIYTSIDEYAYLDVNAKRELDNGRKAYKNNIPFDSQFVQYSGGKYFFTWQGTKINRTISLLFARNNDAHFVDDYNHILLGNVCLDSIKSILDKGKPKAIELASLLHRKDKEKQKYDWLLSDDLLDLEYSATYLDIDSAWDILQNAK